MRGIIQANDTRLIVSLLGALTLAGVVADSAGARTSDPIDPCALRHRELRCYAPSPRGGIDHVSTASRGLRVRGVAIDPDSAGAVTIVVLVDSHRVGSFSTKGNGRFSVVVPLYQGSKVCVRAINRNRGRDMQLGCLALAED